jgi:hypothetical protein
MALAASISARLLDQLKHRRPAQRLRHGRRLDPQSGGTKLSSKMVAALYHLMSKVSKLASFRRQSRKGRRTIQPCGVRSIDVIFVPENDEGPGVWLRKGK